MSRRPRSSSKDSFDDSPVLRWSPVEPQPRSIRRLLNIGVLEGQSWQRAEQLLPMALEHGVSAFISMRDDPVAIQRFAEEVAPQLRDRVASVRGQCNRGTHGDHTFAT